MKLCFNYFFPTSIWYHIEKSQLFLESFLWEKLCEVFPQWHLFFDKRCQVQKGCHPLQSNIIPIGNIKGEKFVCSSITSGTLDMTKEHSDLNFKTHTINTQSILTWFLTIQTGKGACSPSICGTTLLWPSVTTEFPQQWRFRPHRQLLPFKL